MNDMKKYIIPLLLIVLVAVSCKKNEFNGVSDSIRIDVAVTHKTSSSATLSITVKGFTPNPDGLKIINKDTGHEMSFTTSSAGDLSSVKLQGLQSNKKYTINVLLPSGHYSNDYYISSDVVFTTTK